MSAIDINRVGVMMRYSSSRIQQETRITSIDSLINMVDTGRLDPTPIFGEQPNLYRARKSQIIESLILGVPIETVWTQQNDLGKIQLLSGFEILSSILDFRDNGFKLTDLRILKHLEGLSFFNLDYVELKHLLKMDLNLGTILGDSDPLLRCFFVEQINRSAFGLNSAQLARNIIFYNASAEINLCAKKLTTYFKYADQNTNKKDRLRYLLRLQLEVLYCLLLLHITREGSVARRDVVFESYYYSRSHISMFADHGSVEIGLGDDLDYAVNKLMFILEYDRYRLHDYIEMFTEIINKESFDFRVISFSSFYTQSSTTKTLGLFELFYSYLNKTPPRPLRLGKKSTLYDLIPG